MGVPLPFVIQEAVAESQSAIQELVPAREEESMYDILERLPKQLLVEVYLRLLKYYPDRKEQDKPMFLWACTVKRVQLMVYLLIHGDLSGDMTFTGSNNKQVTVDYVTGCTIIYMSFGYKPVYVAKGAEDWVSSKFWEVRNMRPKAVYFEK